MAIQVNPETSSGVLSAIKGALNIFSGVNKASGVNENGNPQPEDEYESSFDEKEIIELVSSWKKTYAAYYSDIDKSQLQSFEYWIGKHKQGDYAAGKNGDTIVDNLIFEAIETFLPIATRANPDPLVKADPSAIGQKLASDIKSALVYEADIQKLRRKLARMTRHWILYRIGVLKVSWDVKTKSIITDNINPKRMIFDKDGYINEGGHFIGEYLGEKKRVTASHLIKLFPKKSEEIKMKCQGKLGTKLEYFEWWYNGTDIFYTLEEIVLGKFKNPNWNYDKKGREGVNHLKEPSYPYVFLSIFSTGLQPHDETSLILQNIPIQDMINRRWRQIDKNVDSMNNGMVVSGKSFTEEQAAQAASALRRGVAIRVPDGDVTKAVQRLPAPSLPADVGNTLRDGRSELRNIFGTAGSSAQSIASQDTVRGKILVNQMDSSRIGGGVTEYIEQVADSVYNLWVQFMFVYYDEDHFITTAGSVSGNELIILKNANFPMLKTLDITVKEGSLIPKDPLTQRNEAIDLWSAGAIDPRSLYKKLDFPDPDEATNQLILWQMLQKGQIQPEQYIPNFKISGSGPLTPPQGVGGPAVNPIGPSGEQPAPSLGQQGPVSAESKQLIESVPIK